MTNQDQATSSHSPSKVEHSDSAQFVGFQLAGQEYAFRIHQIQEIVIVDQITTVPQVPDYVEGVSNLRGAIIPLINLRKLFGLESKPSDGETRTIVVNVGERTMGCLVDSVSQVIRLPASSIRAAPDVVRSSDTSYIAGFAKLAGRLLILLDIDELLDPKKLAAVSLAARQAAALPELSGDEATLP